MRAAAAAVVLLLAVAPARADDAPAQGPDAIAAAKKDFAAIRSSAIAPQTPLSMPSLNMKDLGQASGAPAPSAPAPLPSEGDASLYAATKASTTGNWLVDAMDKDKASERALAPRPGDGRQKSDFDTDSDPARARAASAMDTASGSGARDGASQREPSNRAYNPLDSFMGSWISARDHDLLIPASRGTGLGVAEASPPAGPDPMPSGSLTDMLLPAPDTVSWADSKPEANPFISPSDSETAPAARYFAGSDAASLAPFGLTGAAPGTGPAAQPAENSRTFLPDFAQPSGDDKYFRQMKRF
jgi:hypothetical protein